jgi:hypothetical protein
MEKSTLQIQNLKIQSSTYDDFTLLEFQFNESEESIYFSFDEIKKELFFFKKEDIMVLQNGSLTVICPKTLTNFDRHSSGKAMNLIISRGFRNNIKEFFSLRKNLPFLFVSKDKRFDTFVINGFTFIFFFNEKGLYYKCEYLS